jgi:geranylgeranyl diphosphate synthase type I
MTLAALDFENVPRLLALLDRESLELGASLPSDTRIPERLFQRALFDPLREAASRPGKEFRGRLVDLGYRLAGGGESAPEGLVATVEALHLGSLIVDDIEDGSARRRGGQALHRIFGTPVALNAGNFLYFFPGATLLPRLELAPRAELEARRAIDRAVLDCHYGQALDLGVRIQDLRQREVPEVVYGITRLKTGSLMQLSAELGAIAAGAPPERLAALATLGREIGVSLQMLDDLTGLTSERRCHKGHEDLLGARPTWPFAWLAEQEDDVGYLRLRSLLDFVVKRDVHPEVVARELRERVAERGRRAIGERLRAALAAARASFGNARPLAELADEIARLERYDG